MDLDLFLLAITSLLFFSFFTGVEIAFQSSNKLQIELQQKHGNMSGKIFSYFSKKTPYFTGTLLIGKTISLVLFGIFTARFSEPYLREFFPDVAGYSVWLMLILTFISAIVIVIVGEILTRNLFLINPNRVLTLASIPFLITYILLFPVVFFVLGFFKITMRLIGKEYSDEKPVYGMTDLNGFIRSMQETDVEQDRTDLETKIYQNAMEFKSVRVRECMIPRTEIVAVSIDEGIEKLKEAFVESGHSKIIVYRENIDDVIGFCHSSALFKKPEKIEEILTPIIAVPETTMANELMIKFINERKSLAVVLDEFGGTSGLVSMEDVIEEIFGEIEDEHDEDDLIEQKLDERNYLLSARLEVDYLNDTYRWQLPEGDYETLSGLILAYTENIPKPGEKVAIPPYTFIIQSTLDNRIDVVMMTIEPEKE